MQPRLGWRRERAGRGCGYGCRKRCGRRCPSGAASQEAQKGHLWRLFGKGRSPAMGGNIRVIGFGYQVRCSASRRPCSAKRCSPRAPSASTSNSSRHADRPCRAVQARGRVFDARELLRQWTLRRAPGALACARLRLETSASLPNSRPIVRKVRPRLKQAHDVHVAPVREPAPWGAYAARDFNAAD